MKVTRKGFFSRAIAASAAALLAPKPTARADDGGTAPEIEGTWRFDNLPAPGGGAVSLHTFARGGVVLEIAVLIAGTTAIPRTNSQGVWERIGEHLYGMTFEYFTQRPTGEIVRVQVSQEVLVSGDLMTILSSKLRRFNLNGSPHSEAPCSSPNATGIRLTIEAPSCT